MATATGPGSCATSGAARRMEGRLVTYADLVAMLRAELADVEHRKTALRRAAGELLEKIRRTGRPSLRGRRDLPNAEPDPAAVLGLIPTDVLIDPVMTLTENSRVFPDISLCDAVWRPRAARGPTWSDVHVCAKELLEIQPPSKVAATIAAEKRLLRWLIAFMEAVPNSRPGKDVLRRRAKEAGQVFTGRGFDRAYAEAVSITGAALYSRSGRPKKSPRKITAPV